MMFITLSDGSEFEWHVGSSRPEIFQISREAVATRLPARNPDLPWPFRKVHSVHADGDELTFIASNFTHLPWRYNARSITWFGDHAEFIVNNL